MEKQIEDLKAIREMMEKSSKFLSLSGLSGVITGLTAIAGAGFAFYFLTQNPEQSGLSSLQQIAILLADAIVVIFISLGFGFYFSLKKAKKNNRPIGRLFFCVSADLFSRAVARQVSSAPMSLTSVFGMGTGGPSS